jgi:cytochrome o ubiquinol oxidase subunit 1
MPSPTHEWSRRGLLSMIGKVAGGGLMYQAMASLGHAQASSYRGPLELSRSKKGGTVLVLGAALVVQLWVSIKHRDKNRVFAGDPWDGRSLEWSSSAPPPEYNFAMIPAVTGRDAFTLAKENGSDYLLPDAYADIEMPRNSAVGPVLGVVGFALAFGLVWHIWWMVMLFLVAAVVMMIVHGFARDTTRIIPAQQEHRRWLDAVAAATAISREDERKSANQGLAEQTLLGVPA